MIVSGSENENREMIVSQINRNMFIEAGAGAGKTTLIKNRIVTQLKSGISPEEIVAITFTNAATHELKERITDAVRSEMENSELSDAEKNNLEKALDSLDQMQISTIHSFCNRILKERALDAKIPMEFTLIEEAELKGLMEESFFEWSRLLKKSDWDSLLKAADFKGAAMDRLKALTCQLIRVDRNLEIKMGLPVVDEATFQKEAGDFFQKFAGICVEKYCSAYGFSQAASEEKSFSDIPDEYLLTQGKSVKQAVLSSDWKSAFKALLKPHNTKDFIVKKPTQKALAERFSKEEAKVKVTQAEGILGDIYPFFEKNAKRLTELYGGYLNYLYSPYIEYAKQARDFFFRNLPADILTNDLLIQKTYELLNASEDARNYFREKFKCIYVDEFQDTDHIQASFIRLLAENVEKPGTLRDGALFLVGDPKQSIYRFRGAEPEVYFEVKKYFEDMDNAYVITLQDNYRSNDSVIDWVNKQFKEKKITANQAYCAMNITRKIPKEVLSDDLIHGIYVNDSITVKRNSYSVNNDVADVTNLILNLVESDKYCIYDFDLKATRQITYSDFLLLCMNTRDMDLYAEAFRVQGIPVLMDSKLIVHEEWYLKTFYRLFDFLTDQYHSLSKQAAIEGLIALGNEYSEAEKVISMLIQHTQEMSSLGMLEFLEKNWRILLSRNQAYDISLQKRIHARITQMVMQVMEATSGSSLEIKHAMQNYLNEYIEHELSLEEDENAVRFMNLHKAKGLEGNIVIWLNRQEKTDFREGSLQYQNAYYPAITVDRVLIWTGINRCEDLLNVARNNQAEENVRLEYVACTRAKQACIFMSHFSSGTPLFGADYSCMRSVQNIIMQKRNNQEALNYQDEAGSINATRTMQEALSTPRYLSESPSDFEDEAAGKKGKTGEKHKKLVRPVGGVFGTIMHRTFELLVNRIMIKKNSEIVEWKAVSELCILQAIHENVLSINPDEIDSYKSFLSEAVNALAKWWQDADMTNQIEQYYTELPFSYLVEAEDNRIFRHGFSDLILKLKTGEYLIIDYKSDNDASYDTEEAFVERLKGKYGEQIKAYKDAVEHIFQVPQEKIKAELISFTERDVQENENLRVRVTNMD